MDRVIVNISALSHYEYCPRECALIYVEGQWLDNRQTAFGRIAHQRVDSGQHRRERGKQVLRSIPLWHEALGLSGRADAIEITGDAVVPVEYKSGSRTGDAVDVQLCAQALCIEDMMQVAVPHGYIWYGAQRRRRKVVCDDTLRRRTLDTIESVRRMIECEELPEPAADRRCANCQFSPRCLPEVVAQPLRALYLREELLGRR